MPYTSTTKLHDNLSKEAREFFSKANFLVIKLTDYCNLRCTYCHQDALNGKAVLMSLDTFKNAVRLMLSNTTAKQVNIQFHGGEPLLQPDEFFYDAVPWARAELEPLNKDVSFFIQTNLTKVNEKRQKMLQDLNIGISFSVDGPPEINDKMRGGGKIIFKNFRRLRNNNVDMGTICLIQPTNWDRMKEVLDYFRTEGLTNVRFNMMVPDGRGKEQETADAEKLFQAREVILEQMLEYGEDAVVDSTLYNQMKRFVKPNGAPSSSEYHGCESLYCQAGRSLFSINPNGDFHACDRIAENPFWRMGNVNQEFGEHENKLGLTKRKAFHAKDDWWARCQTCDASKICEFSCSAYYVDEVDTRNVECQQTKMMWEKFISLKDEIISYMKKRTPPLMFDEKKPLKNQGEETWVIKDIAADACFEELTNLTTVAHNKEFKIVKMGEQFFLYLYKRKKIFEVDKLVAIIAQFNGAISPELISTILNKDFESGLLKKTLNELESKVPEIFFGGLPVRNETISFNEV
ncbi:MAG: radical SAM protein [Bdellovibrionota bacterium]